MNKLFALAQILGLGSLLILGSAPAGCLPADPSKTPSRFGLPPRAETSGRRALIVAIAHYASTTGWGSISSDQDVPLWRSALQAQGFAAIEVLTDEKATRKGILEAFREILLEPANPGDLVLFHYSGHGQQITDDGSDEPDGYDEALVPYDAPLDPVAGYKGERHLRDDDLNRLIQELRHKVGPKGHVVVFLDTCFSGTPRGLPERGGPPLGPPAAGKSGREFGSGFYEAPSARGQQVRTAKQDELASYVVFSAARHNQLAQEILGDNGRMVGSLTYAVTRELKRLPPAQGGSVGRSPWTNRRFHERVSWVMAGRVSNQPQVEGDIDTLLFGGGLVIPEPYVGVTRVAEDGRTVRLAAGTLAGLMEGTRIEIHRDGTLRPTPRSRLASGTVVDSELTTAVVELEGDAERAADRSELQQGRAFITHHAFGPLRLTVQLFGLNRDFAARLTRRLEERVSAVELVTERPEITIRVENGSGTEEERVVVETTRDRARLLPPTPLSTPGLEERIGRCLIDYARNRHFRNLRLVAPALQVDLEIVPLRGLGCQGEPVDYATCTGFEDVAPDPASGVLGMKVWQPGDLYRLRAVHRGSRAAHLNLLDLQPDGVIRLFWPPESTRDQTALAPGRSWDFPGIFVVTEPTGVELLLLIASEAWIDLTPFTTREVPPPPGTPRGDLGPFAALFDNTAIRARSVPVYPGRVHTSAVALAVAKGSDGTEPEREP